MSRHQIALFSFTLCNTGSIGPAALQELWERAAGIGNVSVGRRVPFGSVRPVYTLYAPQSLGNLREVEMRLRQQFERAHLNATMSALHVCTSSMRFAQPA